MKGGARAHPVRWVDSRSARDRSLPCRCTQSFTDEHLHHHPNYPAARPLPPDSSQAALRLIADLDEAVRSQNEQDRNRIELSLQWLCRPLETFGVDSFLMYWFALETLAMPGGELVALNKQLAKIFPVTPLSGIGPASSRFTVYAAYCPQWSPNTTR